MYVEKQCAYQVSYFTVPHGYTFHVIEPAYKDHLSIRTTFGVSLGWSLYTSFTVLQKCILFVYRYFHTGIL